MQFAEIYHPVTDEVYGGMQENESHGISVWKSCEKQTWSATAFWSLLLYGLCGLEITADKICIRPYLPTGVDHMELKNLHLDNAVLHLIIDRNAELPCEYVLTRPLSGKTTLRLSHSN